MARLLPCIEDASPFQFSDTLAAVRTWLEQLTDSNPYTQLDWSMYQTIYGYCQREWVFSRRENLELTREATSGQW